MKTCATALAVLALGIGCSAGSGEEPSGGQGASSSGSSGGSISVGSGAGPGSGGTTGIDVPTGGTGGSSDVANGECNQINFVSSRKPVSMLLVLDRSKSMIENNTQDGITRWAAIVPAVTAAVEATDASIHWGLKLYPEGQDTGACTAESLNDQIHVPISPMNGATVNSTINATEALGDGTPTGAAIAAASAYLATLSDDTQKYILLATDGVPSCDSVPSENSTSAREYAVQEIGAALTAGYKTFVLGVLGGSASNIETLNNMGLAGGTAPSSNPIAPKFYHAESNEALIAALQSITSQIASCVFSFEAPPPDPTNIAVKINGELITQDPENGWDYTTDQHLGIELRGSTCQQVRDANQSAIDVIFGCPGVPIK